MEQSFQPLADRIRPVQLEAFFGQTHLLAEGKPLRAAIDNDQLHSMILWGPPGTGKTTLARLIAKVTQAQFLSVSAVLSGVKDIRQAIEHAKQHQRAYRRRTILFVDEAHRFNKAQQDAFLPHIENGDIIFIGATTENPSFEMNNALLSRTRVYVLRRLATTDLQALLARAVSLESARLGRRIHLQAEHQSWLAHAADGDGRRLLNLLEMAIELCTEGDEDIRITQAVIEAVAQGRQQQFDKGGDAFYDQISALHKSVRGTDPDAALYWLCRMLDGGCDPLYIARRVLRMASEDIGNADPRALQLALNAWQTQERLGSPEGELAIAQAVTYLACAPKSNAVYKAFNAAKADAQALGSLPPPKHCRNAPTALMRAQAHGKDYRYAHDEPDAYAAGVCYFPDGVTPRTYYHPVPRGLEIKIGEKLQQLKKRTPPS